jgi:glutathione S-transferase
LVLENGLSASPFVWRARYALAHKALEFESVPICLTQIPKVSGGRFKTVPALEDGGNTIGDSWDIVTYVERAYPDKPPLFTGPTEYAMVKLFDAWFLPQVMRRFLSLYILDILNAARPEDHAYFRSSREAFLKVPSLEAFVGNREVRLPEVREALAPLRRQLSSGPFLGGDTPNYADYIALGAFRWVAAVSTLPLLAKDDEPLRSWIERGFDLYGGIARDDRLKPLFEG